MKFFQLPAVLEYLAKTERLRQVVTQEGLDRELRVRQLWLSRLVDDDSKIDKAWQYAETARFVCELLHRDPSATTAVRQKLLRSQPLRDAMTASGQAELLTKLETLERGP